MAKKDNKLSFVKSTNRISARKIFKRDDNEFISIKNYEFKTMEGLKTISSYDNIIELTAMTMVIVALLCQLRSLRPDGNSAKLDQLPSFKFYKKRVILTDPGHALSLSLAASVPEAVVLLPDEADMLERWLISVLDCYVGNEKFIEKPNASNISDYVSGHMSRILGILNSCPSSNMGVFGIDSSVQEWTIQSVLDRLQLEDLKKVSPTVVIERLRKECFDVGDSPIRFAEVPFAGTNSIEGGCKIEKEIFQDKMPARAFDTSATLKDGAFKIDESHLAVLNDLEKRKYLAAITINKKDIINKYLRIIDDRLKKAPETNNPISSAEEDEHDDSATTQIEPTTPAIATPPEAATPAEITQSSEAAMPSVEVPPLAAAKAARLLRRTSQGN